MLRALMLEVLWDWYFTLLTLYCSFKILDSVRKLFDVSRTNSLAQLPMLFVKLGPRRKGPDPNRSPPLNKNTPVNYKHPYAQWLKIKRKLRSVNT